MVTAPQTRYARSSGDIQIAAEVPPDLSGQLTGQTKAVSVAGTRIFFLAMNLTKAPFNQQKVRVAANQAVDKQALVKALYTGHARALNQPAFPEMVGYSPDVKSYSFDPNAAASVLKGVNAPVVIDVTEADRMLAEAVSGQLEKAGLKASVNVLEDQAFDDSIQTGKSTAYLSSWGVAEGDADVILARHFWSPSRKDAFYTGYKNPELDKLIVAGRSTLDEQKRAALYAQAMQMIMNDAPWVPLLNPEEIYGVSSQVTGWKPSPIGRYNLAHVSLATH